MSHLVWLGTSALDLGAISVWWYCFREREQILDLFEMSSGQRMHTRYFQVGGVMEDIPAGWVEKVRKFTADMPDRADQYGDLLNKNEIVLQRLRGVCPLDEADAARASASPARCCARPATRGTCARRCRTAPTRTSTSRSRSAARATTTTATRSAWRRCKESLQDHRAGARRAARGPVHHRGPQGRAAAAPRARDLDGGADPPLQARHRGLPRARRARSTSRSSRRAASSAASCAPTAPRSPRACTCATRAS